MEFDRDHSDLNELKEFEGDSSFIAQKTGLPGRVNRFKSKRRRRWFLQFLASGAILVVLGTIVLNMMDHLWRILREIAFRVLPDPIVEEIKKVEEEFVSEKNENDQSQYGVQENRLDHEEEYKEYLASLDLEVICPEDVIRPHRNIRNGVANELPPKRYWKRIKPTLAAVEAIQKELGVPLKMINSAYRSPAYNKQCSGAVRNSYHTKNLALDLVFACSPITAGKAAKKLRSQGVFKGGVGVYSSFIHIDTRGKNATWGKAC